MLDFLQTDPVAFTLPIGENGFAIYWYGIIVTLGIALGALWAAAEADKRGGIPDEVYNGVLVTVVAGYIFARLWYVLQDEWTNPGTQYTTFMQVVNLRLGGANILGGFLGAALAASLYMRWRKLNFWLYGDVAGPALLLAQAIGRWGNFINQELYGPPTTLPWGILIANPANRIPPYNDLATYPLDATRFHPTFLYESLWLLAGFILLAFFCRRYRDTWRKGALFGVFLIWWGVGRTWVEFFRPDQPT
ncbi:MAG: prolipoprotein diacylglyceryl transferase, partial [Chloroflexota bacterium]